MIESPSKINLITMTITKPSLNWQTILFNCNCHTFETVIEQLMKALRCTSDTASQLAYVADQFGSATVYKGTKEKCEQVANVLGSVGLLVKVSQ